MQAYTVLADDATRTLYDIDLHESRMEQVVGFKNVPLSEWLPASQPTAARNSNPDESRAVFVDERTCIGCLNCVHQAPESIMVEEDHGRARVHRQWGNSELELENAVGALPVPASV